MSTKSPRAFIRILAITATMTLCAGAQAQSGASTPPEWTYTASQDAISGKERRMAVLASKALALPGVTRQLVATVSLTCIGNALLDVSVAIEGAQFAGRPQSHVRARFAERPTLLKTERSPTSPSRLNVPMQFGPSSAKTGVGEGGQALAAYARQASTFALELPLLDLGLHTFEFQAQAPLAWAPCAEDAVL